MKLEPKNTGGPSVTDKRNDGLTTPTRATSKRNPAKLALGAVLPIVLILTWEVSLRAGWWPESLIAPPSAVLLSFKSLFVSGVLWEHIKVSSGRLLGGFAVGSALGLAYGVVIGLSRSWERFWMPTFLALAPIPIIAWIPLLIVLFGIDGARFSLIALGTFFIVLFGAVNGIRNVDEELVEMARMYGKTKAELARYILIPSALPAVLQALRSALSLSWILLIMAEIIASSQGLGWLLWDSRNFGRSDDMIVAMLTIGLLGKLADGILVAITRRLLWWRQTFEGE